MLHFRQLGPKHSRIASRHIIILLLCVFGCWILFWIAAKLLISEAQIDHADAIAVLSGAAVIKERARWAGRLYREGRARQLILTNDNQKGSWSTTEQRNPFFYEQAVETLRIEGVPAVAIEIIPQPVEGTIEEVSLLKEYAQEHQLHSLLIVTSAYHSRRALWTIRKVFADSEIRIGLVAVPPGEDTPSPTTWWLHVRGWQSVPVEYLKIIYYHFNLGRFQERQ